MPPEGISQPRRQDVNLVRNTYLPLPASAALETANKTEYLLTHVKYLMGDFFFFLGGGGGDEMDKMIE